MSKREIVNNLIIKSKNIIIKKFKTSEIDAKFLNNLNNPILFKFSRHKNVKHTLRSSIKYIKSLPKDSIYLSIKLKKKNEIIGSMTINFQKNFLSADIGILINSKKYFGKGYGLESWINTVNFLSDKVKIRKIIGGCEKNNFSMLKLFNASEMKPFKKIGSKIYFVRNN